MRCGLLGEKLGHSFSREIHGKLGLYDYDLFEVPPEGLDAFMTARDFDGINVTVPYKQAVIPYLDGMSPRAEASGAVNTVVNENGRLWGDNTDIPGLGALIRRMGLDISGKTVLIGGSGGTSLTASAVAESMGAKRSVRMSRSGRGGAMTYEEAYCTYGDAEILINATPAGMYPDTEGCPVDLSRLSNLEGVIDCVYNPLTTRLVLEARERGIKAENGLFMLTVQAVLAAEDFTGERMDEGTAERIYRELCFEKRSIVLTGMPGSGKTTIGTILSRRLGRSFIDTDEEIIRRAGMPVAEIFGRYGEEHFRDLETEVIREISGRQGAVTATGGGAVLRRENQDALKKNGIVVFLDRMPDAILPTEDRPLADDPSKVRRLYEERLPVYRAASDVIADVAGTPERTADAILEKLREL
ncbi:MAG: shikimate dehydrogenase [Oscillospiraceae bacterium]|nr:shikimate dehydrogenase [Oscillospiraceae bacterium]